MAKTLFRSLVAMLVIVPGAVLLQQLRPPEQRVLEGATPAPARFTKSHFRLFREDALRAIRDFTRAANQWGAHCLHLN